MTTLSDFPAPPAEHPAPPGPGEIHVWVVPLDPPPQRVAEAARLLAPDEAERAARFHFERHRRRYSVGRGVLRTLLGGYLGVAPEAVSFEYGEKGKPYLAGGKGAGADLQFNLSNSEELAVVAFARGVELGADVEHLREMPDALPIAERFFSAAERRVLAGVAPNQRDLTFFHCWTRKEAYLKAVGEGITVRLDAFDVTLAPGDEPRMLAIDGDAERGARWTLVHLEPAPGYVGALAVPVAHVAGLGEAGASGAAPPALTGRGAAGWSLAGWRWE